MQPKCVGPLEGGSVLKSASAPNASRGRPQPKRYAATKRRRTAGAPSTHSAISRAA
eukprot:CAMPEP_0172586616 /NCGR_PEP_ID=MMETSP1068-20121228/5954_1 /TAXON_ID=35684 /ORGANISM="Pseudopedinella elastica, Strain CCMP716" /LENGTH=55 /DNA_ID=CAMNT_0013381471 /DNA_START=925 /DNA_END=1088 /DNA_ORIENTATION=+